jgi:hypothetical protein
MWAFTGTTQDDSGIDEFLTIHRPAVSYRGERDAITQVWN